MIRKLRVKFVAAAMLSLIVSFARLLGACLGRSVAVFTTMTLLFVAEVAPSISREGTGRFSS